MAYINGNNDFAVHIVQGVEGGTDPEELAEALDNILEEQQTLIGYDLISVSNFLTNGMGGETGCYVSKTKPLNADDYDIHLIGLHSTDPKPYINETLNGVKKLYVWTDSENYQVSAYRKDTATGTDTLIAEYYDGCTYDKALEIEVTSGSLEYAFYGYR